MKYKEILQIRGKRAALNTILVNLYAALYTAKKEEDQEIQEIECGVQALIDKAEETRARNNKLLVPLEGSREIENGNEDLRERILRNVGL